MTDKEQIKLLRDALSYAQRKLESNRIWAGMEWSYHPLATIHYKSALKKIEEALSATAEPAEEKKMDERAEFEKWIKENTNFSLLATKDKVFYSDCTYGAWQGWQARSQLEGGE